MRRATWSSAKATWPIACSCCSSALCASMWSETARPSPTIGYKPGNDLAKMALLEETTRSATVQAEAPARCLTLSKQDFLDVLQRQPRMVQEIMKALLQRLRHTNVQLQDYARRLPDIPARGDVMTFTAYDTEGFYDEMPALDKQHAGEGDAIPVLNSAKPRVEQTLPSRATRIGDCSAAGL